MVISSGAVGALAVWGWKRLPELLSSERQASASVTLASMEHTLHIIDRLQDEIGRRRKSQEELRKEYREIEHALSTAKNQHERLERDHEELKEDYERVRRRLRILEKRSQSNGQS